MAKTTAPRDYQGPPFRIVVADHLFRLADSGKLCGLAMLGLLVVLVIVVARMEPAQLGPVASQLLQILADRLAVDVPLAVLLVSSWVLWHLDHQSLLREIKRLGDEKSWYAHHPPISRHHGSQYQYPGNGTVHDEAPEEDEERTGPSDAAETEDELSDGEKQQNDSESPRASDNDTREKSDQGDATPQ